jgi:hypothetical protein
VEEVKQLSQTQTEATLRDFIAKHVQDLRNMITNLHTFEMEMKRAETKFLNIPFVDGGPTALDLLHRIIIHRNLIGFDSIRDLQLVQTEFSLLEHTGPGKRPSADILAFSRESGTICLFEIKRNVTAERQAVGELSAYSLGLQNRFWGMNPGDQIWIPVSTAWSRPVKAAMTYQVAFAGQAVLPLSALVKPKPGCTDIAAVSFKLLDLLPSITEPVASSLFAWDCFDALEIAIGDEPSDPRTIVDFIIGAAARLGYSGFVAYGVSSEGVFPYPYCFLIATHNPFRGYLKRRQLEIVLKEAPGGLTDMRKCVKERLWYGYDVDLCTWQDHWDDANDQVDEEAPETDIVSIREIAAASGNRTGRLFREIKRRFDLLKNGYEINTPNLHAMFHRHPLAFPPINIVGYFGVMQEAVYERLLYEFSLADIYGDGPVMGDLGGDAIRRASAADTLFQFMGLMNWEHECQVKYADHTEGV